MKRILIDVRSEN